MQVEYLRQLIDGKTPLVQVAAGGGKRTPFNLMQVVYSYIGHSNGTRAGLIFFGGGGGGGAGAGGGGCS